MLFYALLLTSQLQYFNIVITYNVTFMELLSIILAVDVTVEKFEALATR